MILLKSDKIKEMGISRLTLPHGCSELSVLKISGEVVFIDYLDSNGNKKMLLQGKKYEQQTVALQMSI